MDALHLIIPGRLEELVPPERLPATNRLGFDAQWLTLFTLHYWEVAEQDDFPLYEQFYAEALARLESLYDLTVDEMNPDESSRLADEFTQMEATLEENIEELVEASLSLRKHLRPYVEPFMNGLPGKVLNTFELEDFGSNDTLITFRLDEARRDVTEL